MRTVPFVKHFLFFYFELWGFWKVVVEFIESWFYCVAFLGVCLRAKSRVQVDWTRLILRYRMDWKLLFIKWQSIFLNSWLIDFNGQILKDLWFFHSLLGGISFTFHSGFLSGEYISLWHNQVICSLETISLVLFDPVKFYCFRARGLLGLVVGYEAWTGLTCIRFRGIVINQDFWPDFRLLRDLLQLHFLGTHRGLTLVDVLSKLVAI